MSVYVDIQVLALYVPCILS